MPVKINIARFMFFCASVALTLCAECFPQSNPAPTPEFFMKKQGKPVKVNLSETRKVIKNFILLIHAGKNAKAFDMLHPRARKKRTQADWDTWCKKLTRENSKNNGTSDISVATEKRQTYSDDFVYLVYKIIYNNSAFREERCMLFKIEGDWKIDM
jgi:hypothetical protein